MDIRVIDTQQFRLELFDLNVARLSEQRDKCPLTLYDLHTCSPNMKIHRAITCRIRALTRERMTFIQLS